MFNLLESFREYTKKNKKTKLIHISTHEVYGDVLKGRSKETDPYNSVSTYGATKAAGSELCIAYSNNYDINNISKNFRFYT